MQSPVKQAILEELDTYKEGKKPIFFYSFLSFLFLRQKSICELKIKDNLSGWMSWLMRSNPKHTKHLATPEGRVRVWPLVFVKSITRIEKTENRKG